RSPAALHASVKPDHYLYLTSSINPAGQAACAGGSATTCCDLADTRIYRLLFNPVTMYVSSAGAVRVSQMRSITDITEPPSGSSLAAVGFNAPIFSDSAIFR